MSSELSLTLVQSNLHWENKEANRDHFTALLDSISKPTDVIVLPEMFSTGFSMNTALAETMDGETITWMHTQAKQRGAAICGSLMMAEHGVCYNRFVWIDADNNMLYYDKRHLFRMGNEHEHYHAGTSRILIDYKGWKLFPAVCYDLRFPVWLRRTPELNYDAMMITANWPERRSLHWQILLQARAIENQAYVAAANRVGDDGNGIYYSGNSGLISPRGEWMASAEHKTELMNVTLYKEELEAWRRAFPAAEDADSFSIQGF